MVPVGQGYKKTSSVKNLDSIELTPWVNIPLKTPLMLLSSFVGAAAAKAITHPNSVPLSELLGCKPQVRATTNHGNLSAASCKYFMPAVSSRLAPARCCRCDGEA
jgi:hypothetical protein